MAKTTKKTKKKIKGRVSKQHIQKGKGAHTSPPEIEEIEVTGMVSEGVLANVGLAYAQTIPVGDYASVRVECSLHMPSGVKEEELEATYEFCEEWVDERMAEQIASVTKAYGL